MGAYYNALREEGSREDLLRALEEEWSSEQLLEGWIWCVVHRAPHVPAPQLGEQSCCPFDWQRLYRDVSFVEKI